MKKTLTIFVAVLLASISFAQHANVKSLKGALVKNKISATQQLQNNKFHKALGSRKTVTNVTASFFSTEYYSDDNDWYCLLTDATETYMFYFDIVATTLVPGTTYTLDDMLEDYSYGLDYNTYDEIIYDSVSFTISTTSGATSVNARVVDQNGDVYIITYQQFDPADATDTIDVVCTNVEMIDYTSLMSAFLFYGTNSNYEVTIAATGNQVPGTYSTGDFLASDTYLSDSTDEYRFLAGNMTITQNATGYNLEGYLVFSDYNCYHVTMNYLDSLGGGDTTIVTGDTIDLAYTAEQTHFTDMTEEYGAFAFMGINDDTQTMITIMSSTIPGNYTNEIVAYSTFISFGDEGDMVEFQSGHVTISENDGGYSLEGYMNFSDGNCYHITMGYSIPVANDTVDLHFTSEQTSIEENEELGNFTITGFIADTTLIITVNSATIPGNHDGDIFSAGTLFAIGEDGYLFASGNLNITAVANGYDIEGIMLFEGSHCYHITMEYRTELDGIDSPSRVSMKAYPNPTSNILNVEAEGLQHVTLMDINGRQVISQQSSTIDMSALPNGVYFLRAITTNGIATQKVIKK